MFEGEDYIDVRSPALSVAYHSFRGKSLSLSASGALVLYEVMHWNSCIVKISAMRVDGPTDPFPLLEAKIASRYMRSGAHNWIKAK